MKAKFLNILAIMVVLSMLFAAAGFQPAIAKAPNPKDLKPEMAVPIAAGSVLKSPGASDRPTVYIIKLVDAPVASYRGGVEGYAATSIAVTGEAKLNAKSAASQAYAGYLRDKQAQFVAAMNQTAGRSVEIVHRYVLAYNGIAAKLTPAEAAKVAGLPGVANVMPDWTEYAQTDYGPQWIEADDIWPTTMGEGVVIAIVDTGINSDHPSFADVDDYGYDHTNPTGQFWGWCDSTDPNYDPTLVCNDKLIGMWSGDSDTPEDQHMHGSHVGSIAAGNWLDISVVGNTTTYNPTIHGVAPHANLIAFNIEGTPGTGSAPGTSILAATEAIIDYGVVDIVNYSFGGGPGDPWEMAEHWLNLREAGIFVATSAGNNPPTPLVGSPANAPWMLSVGNSTHNRVQRTSLINMSGGDTSPPAIITGAGFTAGYGPASIVYAGDYPNPNDPDGDPAQCLQPYPAGTFSGQIVVCDRGTIDRVDKGANVLAGGAGGLVLANVAANGESINDDDHYLPAVHIGYTDAQVLEAWLASGSGHTATITDYVTDLDPSNGDVMAAGSSRGPNYIPDIIKPDVTAPGTGILGAEHTLGNPKPAPEFGFHGGTSMASPHAAGAAALLKVLHPTWTAAEIQSALTSTADTGVRDSDFVTPATPFDMGAGSVDLSKAANASLVLHETPANFENANPALGGDPTTLNLATLGDSQCLQTCSWTRTVKNVTGANTTWNAVANPAPGMAISITPTNFNLDPDETQEVTIEVDASTLTQDEWAFASVSFVPTNTFETVHFPIAVVPTAGVLPDLVEINTRRNAGSQVVEDLQSIEITYLTIEQFGLVQAQLDEEILSQDPTNSDPYDNLNDGTTFFVLHDVAAGAKRLVAEITTSEAPDIDLFVGLDTGDGVPQEAELVCASTTASWIESCDVTDPAAGTWWVLVQNWSESGSPPDRVVLASAVVPGSASGNMDITGPGSVPELTPYDLTIYWDLPGMMAGDRYYGAFSLGTDGIHPGNIGTIPINLIRHDDDVTKTVSQHVIHGEHTTILTYEIVVQPNVTPADLAYTIQDTIPAGLTYVADSATATAGTVNVVGDQLTWTGTMPTPVGAMGQYNMTTSDTDPYCDTGFGGYVNLEVFGIFPNEITGDTQWWSAFSSQNPIEFYDVPNTGVNFTDDGFAFFNSTPGTEPWTPTDLPDAAEPNDLMALLWQDYEIFYDGTPGSVEGISLANAGPEISLIEYDDIQPYNGGDVVADFEVVIYSTIDDSPGAYELVFAYDNINSLLSPATIGVENIDATAFTKYLYGDPTGQISDGFMICFDYEGPSFDPVVITYQVEAATPGCDLTFTNAAYHNTDNPGSQQEMVSVDVDTQCAWSIYLPLVWNTTPSVGPIP